MENGHTHGIHSFFFGILKFLENKMRYMTTQYTYLPNIKDLALVVFDTNRFKILLSNPIRKMATSLEAMCFNGSKWVNNFLALLPAKNSEED